MTPGAAPRISVCIPTYNYARYLPQAIESVLSQTFADFELLIIDDGSRDNTREILAEYARRDGRIRVRVNPANIGMVENWNLCLKEARGPYVKYVLADDFLAAPDALGRMASVLDADPGVSLVASARRIVDAESRDLKVLSPFEGDATVEGTKVIDMCLRRQKNLVGEPSAVMFRKEQAGRGFDARYKHLVDLEMWFHLLERGRFAFQAEPLCAFRIHPQQQTAVTRRDMGRIEDMFLLLDGYLEKPYLTLGKTFKRYLRHFQVREVWRLYAQGSLERRRALDIIERRWGIVSFLAWFPAFGLYRQLYKAAMAAGDMLAGNDPARPRRRMARAPKPGRAAS